MAPGAVASLFCALASLSWGRWADPIVDFGREPYLSWQLLEGRTLYRDLASVFGPLSPYVNAAWFRLFGVSLRTLTVSNLAIAAFLALVVFRFLARCCDRLTATAGTAVLLVCFIFAHHLQDAANYNFVWPYTHTATHGTVLLVWGIAALSRAVVRPHPAAWTAAGACLASTLLTKPEIALAAAAAGGVGLCWHLTGAAPRRWRGPFLMLAAGTLPLGACVAALGMDALLVPLVSALRVTGGESVFYARITGTDDLLANGTRVAADAVLWSAAVAALVVADLRAPVDRNKRRWIRIAAAGVVGALIARDVAGVGRALPLLVPVAGGGLAWIACRRRRQGHEADRLVPLLVWAAAAWVLLWKMLLNVRFDHYGFYLAMPAAVLAVALGVGTLPRLLAERSAAGGWLVRPVALSSVGFLLLHSLTLSSISYAHMNVPVGRGADAHLGPSADASPSATVAAALYERIETLMPPGATLAVLPEGVMLNFLTRRPNPTPYHQLTPPEVRVYGTDSVVAAYEQRPPQYVLLLDWSGREYGVRAFGESGWGAELVAWVRRRYDLVESRRPASGVGGFSLWRLRV
jgi:hypothetical protein